MAAREILTQLVRRKERELAHSYLYSGYLKGWLESCLSITLLPSHLEKPIPESDIRIKMLERIC